MVDDFLSEMVNEVSGDSTSLKAKKFNLLLPPLKTGARRYYKLKRDDLLAVLDFLTAFSILLECYLSLVRKTSVTVAAEMQGFEASSKPVIEFLFWLDW